MMSEWAWALGRPECHGTIRSVAEDFIVDERLGFSPEGEGNHALLHVRKRGCNTEWVARQLAELAGVPLSEVGYAGLKDRHAVTSQFFTVHLSGVAEPDWQRLDSDALTILEVDRHRRKLRRGRLRANHFCLTVRHLHGRCEALERRLQAVAARGVPNYFGEQRFGHHGDNLERARAIFRGQLQERDRHKRGLYLSAARSWLFNRVLSARVEQGSWNRALPGESLISNGTSSAFSVRLLSSEIERKVEQGELHPSGPLWGRGQPSSLAQARECEREALQAEAELKQGLEATGMEQARRPLRLPVEAFSWEWPEEGVLRLSFSLQAGGYATSVLRELIRVDNA
ncbi:MAG: tRNA pseudouridine(13) synthase TruD [Pseudomonadota bacterium]